MPSRGCRSLRPQMRKSREFELECKSTQFSFLHDNMSESEVIDVCGEVDLRLSISVARPPASKSASNAWLFAYEIWGGSKHLATMLAERPWICKGKSVLEVGCAAALPAVVAAGLGAKVVVASDTPADLGILDNARQNFERNNLEKAAVVLPHKWGEDASALTDRSVDKQGFDLVIASECIWLEAEHSNLLDTICATLRKPDDKTTTQVKAAACSAAGGDGFARLEGGRLSCAILTFCHHDGPGSGMLLFL